MGAAQAWLLGPPQSSGGRGTGTLRPFEGGRQAFALYIVGSAPRVPGGSGIQGAS